MALELIGSVPGIGRQQLAKRLEIGEGTCRTLIRRLMDDGLIDISRGGMVLTAKGVEVKAKIGELIVSAELPETDLTVGPKNYGVFVRNASGKVKQGVEQRDAALIAGAKGATTLIYEAGRLRMPGMDMDPPGALARSLTDRLKPREGDVIIIGTANTSSSAEMGAKAAALELLGKSADVHR
jgi:DNA-binding transcriptional regulator LsrR (DeoR family)